MKYVAAFFGAVFVAIHALLGVLIIPPILGAGVYRTQTGFIAMHVLSVSAALCAGVLSFRALLRFYEKREENQWP